MKRAFAKLKPYTWQLLLLAALGALGNIFPLPIFFGVEYLFGGVAVLMATALFGPAAGLLVSILPAVQTIFLWHHPYAAIPLLLEPLVVALALRRFGSNLALAGMLFWIFVGVPLVFLLYRYALGMPDQDALIAALKQSSNGITNSVAASLLVTYVPQLRAFRAQRGGRLSLFETIFNSFLAAALIPVFAILTVDARRALGEAERDASLALSALSSRLSLTVGRWREDHVRAISALANIMELHRPFDRALTQEILAAHLRAWPNFYGSFVCDARGVSIAFVPEVNTRGESTIGISFADRPYFQKMRDGSAEPDVSPVFLARGGIFEPVSNVTVPIRPAGRFQGIVSGSLNLNDLRGILSGVKSRYKYEATVVDASGRVVASSSPSRKPLDHYPHFEKLKVDPGHTFSFRRWPVEPMPPMLRWKKSSLGTALHIPGTGSWFLLVEASLSQQQDLLYSRYGQVLTLFIALAFALLIASSLVAAIISRPLAQLSHETTNVPEKIGDTHPVRWPASGIFEVNQLVENFRMALGALGSRFEELEKSRSELDRANRTKDEFLWTASHELKTPLTPLKLQLQILSTLLRRQANDPLDPARVQRSFQIAEQQIDRLSRLIDDLLDVSRIDAGKLKLNFEELDLAATVRTIAEQYSPHLSAAGCTLEVSAPPRLVVKADPLRIEQVLGNLLTNAAKYAPKSQVRLSLGEEPGRAVLTVADNGPGIPASDQARVFDRFERAHSSSHVTGLGLGLFITRQIVEGHAGQVELKSEPGRGTTFTVRFPLG